MPVLRGGHSGGPSRTRVAPYPYTNDHETAAIGLTRRFGQNGLVHARDSVLALLEASPRGRPFSKPAYRYVDAKGSVNRSDVRGYLAET